VPFEANKRAVVINISPVRSSLTEKAPICALLRTFEICPWLISEWLLTFS